VDDFNDPDLPHVTVPCASPSCGWSFFVAKDDPRLPDGPFHCAVCRGAALSGLPKNLDLNTSPRYELKATCDGCGAQLRVEASSTREAWQLLKRERAQKGWNAPAPVTPGGITALGALATRTRNSATLQSEQLDLCGECNKP
jgi:hypothetical protein